MNPEIEYASKAEINNFQIEKLKALLNYLSTNSAFYKRLFKTHQIDITNINSLKDLSIIPTTSKDDVQQYND